MNNMRHLRDGGLGVRAAAIAVMVMLLQLAACREAPPPTPVAPLAVPRAPAVDVAPPHDARPAEAAAPARAANPVPSTTMAAAESAAPPARIVLPALDFPPGPLYFCVVAGERRAIEYEPRVEDLCRRHPEMSPCQYERNACRAQGGRVFTARAEEVTPAVEAEYDRSVRRVTLRGDAPARR